MIDPAVCFKASVLFLYVGPSISSINIIILVLILIIHVDYYTCHTYDSILTF